MTFSKKNYLLDLKNAKTSAEMSQCLELFYHDSVHLAEGYCFKKGLTKENTEEVLQIIYTQIFNKRHLYDEKHSPLAWLYIITKSETKDYLKKEKRLKINQKEYTEEFKLFLSSESQNLQGSPSNYQEANSKMLDLDYIKQNLNENEIKLIRLRFEEELNFEEIAQILNSSSQNIRKALSRLTQKIKKTVQSG